MKYNIILIFSWMVHHSLAIRFALIFEGIPQLFVFG